MHMFYNNIHAYIYKYNSATWITPSGCSNCEVKNQVGMALYRSAFYVYVYTLCMCL